MTDQVISRTPICTLTYDELRTPTSKPTDLCAVCSMDNHRCPIGYHRREQDRTLTKKLVDQELALDDMDIWNSANRSKYEQQEFKVNLIKYYKRWKFLSKKIKCMITDKYYPPSSVCASHIWKASQMGRGLHRFNLLYRDAWSPRNGMLLLKHIEECFDVKDICFVHDPFRLKLVCRVLNPSLVHVQIRDSEGLTFADIDGKDLQHPQMKRPFRRLLSFHAKCSFTSALKKGWISQEAFEQFEPYDNLSNSAADPLRIYVEMDE